MKWQIKIKVKKSITQTKLGVDIMQCKKCKPINTEYLYSFTPLELHPNN